MDHCGRVHAAVILHQRLAIGMQVFAPGWQQMQNMYGLIDLKQHADSNSRQWQKGVKEGKATSTSTGALNGMT
jgi:hypothetical protein